MTELILGVIGLLSVTLAILVIPLWRHGARISALLLAVGLVLFTAGCYFLWGAGAGLPTWLKEGQAQLALRQALQANGGQDALLQRLKAAVEKTPTDARGWYLLGRVYLVTGQSTAAVHAFSQAQQLNPNNPTYLYAYAQGLFLEGKQLAEAQTLLAQVLTLSPGNIDALNLQGLVAYAQEDYPAAITSWQRAQALLTPDDPRQADFSQAIESAKAKQVVLKRD